MSARNPFPGMNPWLGPRWGDFHQSLIGYLRDELQGRLPGPLRARMESRVFVEDLTPRRRELRPDVYVSEGRSTGFDSPGGSTLLLQSADLQVQPWEFGLGQTEEEESYVTLIDASTGGTVVTLLEVLSPANKRRGAGRNSYREKQADARAAGVNLVEIDLVRGGLRTTLGDGQSKQFPYAPAYHVSVWRAASPGRVQVYGTGLREALPIVAVPLRADDEPVTFDLQALVNLCHERGRYDDVDYRSEPEPPLPAEDLAWARGLAGLGQ